MARNRVVIIGGGFAGYQAAKTLSGSVSPEEAEIVLVNPTDYFLYLPLLPEVAAGILDPRRVSVSLPGTLPKVRLALGEANGVDLERKELTYTDPEGEKKQLSYDRLMLAAGSVNKLLPIPGVTKYAHGFRGIAEALYLRDHITRQVELAAAAEDQAERDARCTFVIVGAGYTGTEIAAQGPEFTKALAKRHPELVDQPMRWRLLDIAPRVLPELDTRLGDAADRVLRSRGVQIQTETSVSEATEHGVTLSDGEFVPTHTLMWCVGVRPDPLAADIGNCTDQGRILVDEYLGVPGQPDVFAAGDAAAVPDLTRPGEYTAMTAQHAVRQGKLAGRNVAASLRGRKPRRYKHHDLGFVVDLGAGQAAANPLRIPLSGFPAKMVTRGYHLLSMPGNRIRTATEWLMDYAVGRQTVQLGLVRGPNVPLDSESPETPRMFTGSYADSGSAGSDATGSKTERADRG